MHVRIQELRYWSSLACRQFILVLISVFSFLIHRLQCWLMRLLGVSGRRAVANGYCVAMDGRLLIRSISGLERYIAQLVGSLVRSNLPLSCRLYTLAPYRVPDTEASPTETPDADRRYINVWSGRAWGFFFCLFRDLGRGEIDLWHLLWTDLEPTVFLPMAFAPASVLTIHDLIILVWPGYSSPSWQWVYLRLLRWACRRADAILVDSSYTRQDVQKVLGVSGDRVHVVYLGIDPRFKPLADAALVRRVREKYTLPDPFILTVGKSFSHKNFPDLIRVVRQLRDKHLRLEHLVIAGPKDYPPGNREIEQAIDEVDGHSWVHWLGAVDDVDLPALYNAAQVFCFPSLYEGFGLPVLEAMACGIPVVCSSATSLPEVAGDAALLVDARDRAALAQTLLQVLTDPALRQSLRQRGLERAAQFTWDQTSHRTLEIYEQIYEQMLRRQGKR